MLKKLVALTLAALMLINPITAFAVTWDSMLQGLEEARKQNANKYTEEGVTLEVEGTNAKIYGDGILTDFYNVDEFTNYTFSGTIRIGGEEFEVYVHDVPVRDENGDEMYNEDGTRQMQAQQVVVNVENGVAIEATEVRIGADDNSTLVVTTKGNIGFDAEGNLVTEHVSIDVNEEATSNAKIEFTNEGDIAASNNIWMGVDGEGKLIVTNEGTMTAEKEIGMHAYGNGEGEMTNNGTMTANASGNGEEGDQVGLGVHGEGSIEFVNGEEGVINGKLTGWLDNDATNGTLNMTNEGTVNGDMGAWGFDGSYEDEEGNWVENTSGGDIKIENTGDVTGNLGTFTNDDIASTITNSGTVEGEMFAHNNGTQNMNVWNTNYVMDENGDVVLDENGNPLTTGNTVGALYVSNNSSAATSVNNDGTVVGNVGMEAEDGSMIFVNNGTIDNVGVFNEGYDENGDPVSWPADVNFSANGDGNLNVVNTGSISTEEVYIRSNGESSTTVTNMAVKDENGDVIRQGAIETQESLGMWGDGTIEFNNGGVISTDLDKSESWYDENGDERDASSIWGDALEGGSITFTNEEEGSISGYVGMGAIGEGSSLTMTNYGETEYLQGNASEGAETNLVNDGKVTVQMTNTADRGGVSTSTNNDGAYAEWMWSHAEEGGSVSSINNGSAGNQGGYSESDDSSVAIMNNGTVDGWLDGYMFGNGNAEIVNNGYVGIKVSGVAGGEGSVTAVNTSKGTIGDGVRNEDNPPDGLWVSAENGGTAAAINDGTINGEIGGGAYGEGSMADVVNTENGTADTSWVDAHGGELALNNEGEVKGTLSVSIGTQSNEVTSTDTVAQLLEQTGVDISGYSNVDIYTANQDGELIARYSVAADGTVVLEEVLMEQGGGGFDDPRFWTEERIRHDKEEERKAAAIGGVYGSPYWLKQLYLGYMSLNLRLFSGEDQLLFKESLSWVPDTGKLGEKVLTLKVKSEDTSALTMRLDGSVIEKLEQAGIVSINIVDGAGNLFMEYKVQDLKDARAMYGLTEAEYIVVGAADADVLKIAEDGTVSPIEGEAAEEVADEANKEATEEPAEETPAA